MPVELRVSLHTVASLSGAFQGPLVLSVLAIVALVFCSSISVSHPEGPPVLCFNSVMLRLLTQVIPVKIDSILLTCTAKSFCQDIDPGQRPTSSMNIPYAPHLKPKSAFLVRAV